MPGFFLKWLVMPGSGRGSGFGDWVGRMKEEEFTKQDELEKLTGHLSGNVRCIRTLAMTLFFFMSFLGDFSPECLKESEILVTYMYFHSKLNTVVL